LIWRSLCESKKTLWLWTVVNPKHPGILKFVVGDHALATFQPLWQIVVGWACFLYITDGDKVN
jgi:insertion element IS1 protein InsB